MKRSGEQLTSLFRVVGLTLLALVSFGFVSYAQTPFEDNEVPQVRRGNQMRSRRLLRILNLTPEQLVEIRRLSAQSVDERRQLQQRWQAARRALDDAIYSNADEATIELRVREAAQAQAAIVRMRALTEYRIRRVLTPQQLETLRALRERSPNGLNRRRNERVPQAERFRRRQNRLRSATERN